MTKEFKRCMLNLADGYDILAESEADAEKAKKYRAKAASIREEMEQEGQI